MNLIRYYFKQAFCLLRENRLLSAISILGTGLAMAMIMVEVISLRVTMAPLTPETHRDRMLIFQYAGLQNKENPDETSNGPVSYRTAKACLVEMTTPEAVSIAQPRETMLAMLPGSEKMSCVVIQSDDKFWQVFQFDFLAGKPFDRAEFDAGATKAVISEEVAHALFGTNQVVGRTFLLNHTAYTVCGVVRSVSKLATYTYAQVWIPLSSTDAIHATWGTDGIMGMVSAYILAKSSADFPAIREEADLLKKKYMASYSTYDLLYREQPDTYFVAAQRHSSNNPPRVKEAVRKYVGMLLVLLIVPAVNLSGLTLSRMRKRLSEIGVRKAFGASRYELMAQVLTENMLYSLLGGVLGLLLSYLAVFSLSDVLFGSSLYASDGAVGSWRYCLELLFDPIVFLLAFLFCFVLNLLSAGIPAWRVTRTHIVEAINKKE